jgi:hypothetical protein
LIGATRSRTNLQILRSRRDFVERLGQAFEQPRQPEDAVAVVMLADHIGLHGIACARMWACLDAEKR